MKQHPQKQSLERWTRYWRLAPPSSHWTTGFKSQWFFFLILGTWIVHLFLAYYLPPTEDELYYWNWSKKLSLSYFDHPPLVGYLIRISTFFFGDSILSIRFFSTVSSAVILFLLGSMSTQKTIYSLILFTPFFLLGGILMTPDVPLLLFWTLYYFWNISTAEKLFNWSDDPISRVYHKSPVTWTNWTIGGVLLGLGLLSKYSMFLAPLITLISLGLRFRASSWIKGYALHLFIAFLFCLPILIFNYQHNFEPFIFQWNHLLTNQNLSLRHFFRFLGSQVVLLGALPFLFIPLILIRWKTFKFDPVWHVSTLFFLLPLLYFAYRSVRSQVDANWAIFCYLSFWILAQKLLDQSSFKSINLFVLMISFLPPISMSGLFFIHLYSPFTFIKPENDRILRLISQYRLTKEVTAKMDDTPLYCSTYQWVSYFRYLGLNARLLEGGRRSQYSLELDEPCRNEMIYVFTDKNDHDDSLNCFSRREVHSLHPLLVRNKILSEYHIVKYDHDKAS